MNGEPLDPEPDGTGPLRYVAPQYSPDETNKPSWVSNVRLIEVGPLKKGLKRPEAKDVPVEEVWVYGSIPRVYPYSMVIPLVIAGAALVVLILAMIRAFSKRSGKKRAGAVGSALLIVMVLGAVLGLGHGTVCRAQLSSTFSLGELKSMPAFSGRYTFLKQLPPYTYYEEDYTGVPLSYLIEQRLNLAPGAGGVVVKASDGYTTELSRSQVDNTYPGGLKVIIAYSKDGTALTGDEGPLRLIVPQSSPGTRDQGGDANTPLCARMVSVVEVTPSEGVAAPDPKSVPSGSLAVYGAVTAPAQPENPPPQAQPQPQPQPNATPQQQAQSSQAAVVAQAPSNAVLDAFNRTFGGQQGFVSWLCGAWLQYVLPGRQGLALWLVFSRLGR